MPNFLVTLAKGFILVVVGVFGVILGNQLTAIKYNRLINSPKIVTSEEATQKVSQLPAVKEYLAKVPNGKVVLENENADKTAWVIHVVELVNDHTATFNWYEVNKSTGEIKSMF
jgi:hypothetical protein